MQQPEAYRCRICNTTEANFYCRVKDETSRETGLEFTYVKCGSCGTLSLCPLPTPEQTAFANESLLGLKRPGSSFDQRYTPAYRQPLRDEYLKTLTDIGVEIEPPTPNASCLDFGCADGGLLDLLADHGWQTYGCDVSHQLTELADHDRHQMHVGELSACPADWGPFDMIVTIEVLEHLPDPVATLSLLVSMLKPGGVLVTETPQVGLLAELYGERWRVLNGLDHIHLLPQTTQFELITRLGCRIEKWISFGSGCTSGLTPPQIKSAFDTLVKRQGIGDFLAIKSVKDAA